MGFGAFDLFLEFVLVDLLHEFSSDNDEEVIEVVYGASGETFWHKYFRVKRG